jgi:galactokinase/mevalonate kinase-like predicted kinase
VTTDPRVPKRGAEASAPLAALLADGVAVALDRRASCRIEPAAEITLEDKAALLRFAGATLSEATLPPGLIPLASVLRALGLERELRASAHGRVPASTGLGVVAALALAAATAATRACEQAFSAAAAMRLVEQALGPSPALRLALASAHLGQVVTLEHGQVRRVAADPARVEQALLLVDSGVPARPVPAVDAPERVEAGRVALVAALEQGDDARVPEAIASAWAERVAHTPEVATPEAEHVLELARRAGGAGRPCGPGGGGLLLLWLPPDTQTGLRAELTQAGLRVFPCRLDLLGLDIEG